MTSSVILTYKFLASLRSFCEACKRLILRVSKQLKCIECKRCWHSSCLKEVIQKYFLCVNCAFNSLPFCEEEVCVNIISSGNFTRKIKNDNAVKLFNFCNLLENQLEDNNYFPKIDSKYISIEDFNKNNFDNNSLGVLHLNVASLNKYLTDLQNFLALMKFQFNIIGISEHKINKNNFLHFVLSGYDFVYNPCITSHGGTGFFISSDLSFKLRSELVMEKPGELESTVIEVLLPNQKNLICACVYRHPYMSINDFNENFLSPFLESIQKENKLVLIIGDFNVNLLRCESNTAISKFSELFFSHKFSPYVLQPTRLTANSATLIDNIFFNAPEFFTTSGNFTEQISDHLIQFLVIKDFLKGRKNLIVSNVKHRNYDFFNDDEFRNDLKTVSFESIYIDHDVNKSFENFYNKIDYLLDEHAPYKRITQREKRLQLKPWITKSIKNDMLKRNKLFKKYCQIEQPDRKLIAFNKYKLLRNEVKQKIAKSKKVYYEKYFQENKNDLKSLWQGIKSVVSFKPQCSKSPSRLSHLGNIITDQKEIADIFVDFFSNIGPDIAKKIPKVEDKFEKFLGHSLNDSLFLFPTTNLEVINIIKGFKKNKCLGPNSIPSRILLKNYDILSPHISNLINLSFCSGVFPDFLKTAKIVPVFKKGNSLDCSNYRPISLLSIFSKIIEKCMSTRLRKFIDKKEILYKKQFGFRTKYSTSHALLSLIESIKLNIDSGKMVAALFIDLQKAFDTVDHQVLLGKLYHYGIRGVALNWFRSYLENRKQFVIINGVTSKTNTVLCGVPQGSTLGPLLFILYINDLNLVFKKANIYHFADDTNLLVSGNKFNTIQTVMNHEIKKLVIWLRANKLSLNESKSELVIFRSKKFSVLPKNLSIKLNKYKLSPSSYVKYLGVVIDEFLNWKPHVEILTQKVSKAIGILSKLRYYFPLKTCINVYHAIVHSHFKYGALVWQFCNEELITKLFMLQKRCLRLITFSALDDRVDYFFISCEVLKLSDVLQLELLKFLFCIVNKFFPQQLCSLFSFLQVNQSKTRHNNRFLKTLSYNTVRYGKMSLRSSPDLWNKFLQLKPHIFEAKSLKHFTSLVTIHLRSSYGL